MQAAWFGRRRCTHPLHSIDFATVLRMHHSRKLDARLNVLYTYISVNLLIKRRQAFLRTLTSAMFHESGDVT